MFALGRSGTPRRSPLTSGTPSVTPPLLSPFDPTFPGWTPHSTHLTQRLIPSGSLLLGLASRLGNPPHRVQATPASHTHRHPAPAILRRYLSDLPPAPRIRLSTLSPTAHPPRGATRSSPSSPFIPTTAASPCPQICTQVSPVGSNICAQIHYPLAHIGIRIDSGSLPSVASGYVGSGSLRRSVAAA